MCRTGWMIQMNFVRWSHTFATLHGSKMTQTSPFNCAVTRHTTIHAIANNRLHTRGTTRIQNHKTSICTPRPRLKHRSCRRTTRLILLGRMSFRHLRLPQQGPPYESTNNAMVTLFNGVFYFTMVLSQVLQSRNSKVSHTKNGGVQTVKTKWVRVLAISLFLILCKNYKAQCVNVSEHTKDRAHKRIIVWGSDV